MPTTVNSTVNLSAGETVTYTITVKNYMEDLWRYVCRHSKHKQLYYNNYGSRNSFNTDTWETKQNTYEIYPDFSYTVGQGRTIDETLSAAVQDDTWNKLTELKETATGIEVDLYVASQEIKDRFVNARTVAINIIANGKTSATQAETASVLRELYESMSPFVQG